MSLLVKYAHSAFGGSIMSGEIDSNHGAIIGLLSALRLRAGGRLLMAACTLVLPVAGCDGAWDSDDSHRVNGSIHVPAGKQPSDATTVNGAIHIDDNAAVMSAAT